MMRLICFFFGHNWSRVFKAPMTINMRKAGELYAKISCYTQYQRICERCQKSEEILLADNVFEKEPTK